MSEAKLELDLEFEMLQIALGLGSLASAGAQIVTEEIKSSLLTGDEPAPPGEPPRGTGALRESWRATRPVRPKRGKQRISAFSFSLASTDDGESLNSILDEGRGSVHPHPFLSAALARAEKRFAVLISNQQAELSATANAARGK